MKTFVLASLIAATAAGCVSDDDTSTGELAHIGATWSINSYASNSEIPCPPGYDTAALYNQPVDSNGNAVGSPIIDLFDCEAGAGTSAALPADTYETWIEITTHDNTGAPYAKSTPAYVDVIDVDKTYNAKIYDDAGYFGFQWDLVGASGAPLTCADAGIDDPNVGGVELLATISGSDQAADEQFNCTDHTGITDPLPAGDYTLSIDAFTDADGRIGDTVNVPNASILDHNQITDLGTFQVPIDGL
jgi:hypothetical protein